MNAGGLGFRTPGVRKIASSATRDSRSWMMADSTTMHPPTGDEALDAHLEFVAAAITECRVVPFLGAGANLVARPQEVSWTPEAAFLPDGGELALHLRRAFPKYDLPDNDNLLRVSQYARVVGGLGWLYDKLHELFSGQYEPGPVHDFLANLAATVFAASNAGARTRNSCISSLSQRTMTMR